MRRGGRANMSRLDSESRSQEEGTDGRGNALYINPHMKGLQ